MNRTCGFALATPFLSLVGCSDEERDALTSFGGGTMGTTYSVKLAAMPEGLDVETLAREVDGVLEGVNQAMSTYLPESELSQFNDAEAGAWTEVSADTLTVVEQSIAKHAMTGGAFDPTVGPVVDLWGFGPDGTRDAAPADADVAQVARRVGLAKIESRRQQPALRKHADGVRLDLSGVAKGFAVDKVAELLDAKGAENYLVEVGGELRSRGSAPGGRAWRVGIEKPTLSANDMQKIVHLEGEAMATSGNYRIFFESDGRRYSHIVDPTTGRPVEHDLASVTVLAPTTLEADALSTALLLLVAARGLALAEKQHIAAFFITGRDGVFQETASPAFTRRQTV